MIFSFNRIVIIAIHLLVISCFVVLQFYFHIQSPYITGLIVLMGGVVSGIGFIKHKPFSQQIIFGLLIFVSFIIIFNTVAYYLYFVTNDVLYGSLVIAYVLPVFFLKRNYTLSIETKGLFTNNTFISALLFIAYIVLFLTIAHILAHNPITIATRSLWGLIPSYIFPIYILTTITLLLLIAQRNAFVSMVCIGLHYLLTFSCIWMTYKLGYGFDPFLHQASEKILIETGTLLPKPPYYIGQYVTIASLHSFFNISITYADRLLVPIGAALTIPFVIYSVFKDSFTSSHKLLPFLSLIPLCFVFNEFTYTTPQSFANLWAFLTVLLSIYYIGDDDIPFLVIGLPALVALCIHPLAGIPIFFFVIIVAFYHRIQHKLPIGKQLRRIIFWQLVALSIIILPLAFILNSTTGSTGTESTQQGIITTLLAAFPKIYWHDFHSVINIVYTYIYNEKMIFIVCALIGLLVVARKQKTRFFLIYPLYFGALIITYIILSTKVDFSFLISYEQNIFPTRVLKMSFLALYPLVLICAYFFIQKINKKSPSHTIFFIFCGAIMIGSAWYASYPRFDDIYKDKGYNTSNTDFKIVNALDQANKNNNYIVLANQAVSAAAIQEFGFKKYYTDKNVFFYPIPTSGPLYSIYTDMVYNTPSREKAADAALLTDVNNVFFVVNKYWVNYDVVVERAKASATEWWSVDDGNAHVFYYKF